MPADKIYNYQIGGIPYSWAVKSTNCPECQCVHVVPVRDSGGDALVRDGATILQCLQCLHQFPNPNDLADKESK
jgi:hypothetical protein